MAALQVIERRRAEGHRGRGRILAAANDVDIGRVVGAGGGRDRAIIEQSSLDRQHLARRAGHEHDVHEFLLDDLHDDVTKLAEAAIAQLAAMGLGRTSRRADGEGHVGVLGVGEDEVLAAVRVGVNALQFLVERFFHYLRPMSQSRPNV